MWRDEVAAEGVAADGESRVNGGQALQDALVGGQFRLHYQPKLSLARMSLVAEGFAVDEAAGYEVCRSLRGDPATAGCTIVMLTPNAASEAKVEAFSCGADDYIIKPFSPRDLVGRVRSAMHRRNDGHRGGQADGDGWPE